MKVFISIFAVSITVFFFFSLSVAYSWAFYLSSTIHKSYMFLLCNSLLVFICLNSRSTVSPERGYGQELAEKKQAAGFWQSGPPERSRTVGEVGDEKETGSLHVVQVREDRILIAEDNDEKFVFVEEARNDELEVMGDDMTPFVLEKSQDDELEAEDDKTLSVVEETRDDNEQEQGGGIDMILSVVEETRDDELEVVEDDMTLFDVEETQDDELEAEDDKALSVVEETQDDDEQEQEQGGGIDMISLEELNKKFEEFIRTTKMKIRAELLTIQCY